MFQIVFALIALTSFTVHHFDATATKDIKLAIEEQIAGECEYVKAADKSTKFSLDCKGGDQKSYSFDLKNVSLEDFSATGAPCSIKGTLKRGLVTEAELSCESHLVSKREE